MPAVVGCTCIVESCLVLTSLIMYAFVEEPSRTHCGSSVQSLSWMGKAPEGQPESGTAWRLSENSYYDEGWLASGNSRGVVGVTMTGCRSTQNSSSDVPLRTNFNLRGHRSEVGISFHFLLLSSEVDNFVFLLRSGGGGLMMLGRQTSNLVLDGGRDPPMRRGTFVGDMSAHCNV